MSKLIALTLVLIAALVLSMLPDRAFARQDQVGNIFPAWCTLETLASINLPIVRATPQQLNESNKNFNAQIVALWIPGLEIIMVSDRLAGWKYDDALEHEKCHSLTNKLYPETKGQWHK